MNGTVPQTRSIGMSASPLAPSADSERIELIDALRGFALAGVLLANLGPFSLYEFLDEAARMRLPTYGFDVWARYATNLLVAGKALTLFSLLFGIGFYTQLERAQGKGVGLAPYLRRTVALLLIGCLHTYLLWWGDILLTYAVLAFVLIAFRGLSNRMLLISGLTLALSWPLFKPVIEHLQPNGLAGVPQMHAANLAAFSSNSPAAVFTQNIAYSHWNRWAAWGVPPFVFAGFLLGYWAGRIRLLSEPQANGTSLRLIVLVGGLAGLVASVAVPRIEFGGDDGGGIGAATLHGLQIFVQRFGPLGMGCAYGAGFALLFQRSAWHRWLRRLAPFGRMALTNYLLQTVLCVALFYGVGLGLGPNGGYPVRLLVFAVVLTGQIAFSHWWLARYRFGPIEWAWRCATYARLQPLRRAPVTLSER